MADGDRAMPSEEYPDVLRAISDYMLERGRDGEAMLMREVADWIEGTIHGWPAGIFRYLSEEGVELAVAPIRARLVGDMIVFDHSAKIVRAGTLAGCSWDLPSGESLRVSAGLLSSGAEIQLSSLVFTPGGTINLNNGRMNIEGQPAECSPFLAAIRRILSRGD